MNVPLFDYTACGRIGWFRAGERIIGAGEEAGQPFVRKVRTAALEGVPRWVGDCGNAVVEDSTPEACLELVPLDETQPLDANRPWAMSDWPASVEH